MWFTAWISPSLMEISSAWPPAFSTALRGSVYSTSSTPSVARKATLLPLIDVVMRPAPSSLLHLSVTAVPGLGAGKRRSGVPVHQLAAVPGREYRPGQRQKLHCEQTPTGHPVMCAHSQHQDHGEQDEHAHVAKTDQHAQPLGS